MHISCENCGTTYVLDERLIPPQGAPVQCTRCQHVFTAVPPASMANTPPPAAPASQTMMFGAPGSTTPPPSSKPASSSTQMFGALGPQSPNPAGGKPASNSTQMFGALGPTPASSSKKDEAPRSTQVFGALSPQAPNAAGTSKPANSTQMFGAIGAEPPTQKSAPQSIDFGKQGSGQGSSAAGRSTMIFGAGGPGSTPKAGKSDATVRVGPEDLERMLKEHRELTGRGTETTPSEGSPAVPPDRHNATQMFAMKDAMPPESVTPTGDENAASASEARRDKTQLFAYSDSAKPPDEQTDPGQARRDRTQLFAYSDASGAPPAKPATEEPARHQKTQMFALTDNAPTSPQPIPEGAKEDSVSARHQKTQMFALNDAPPLAPVTEPLEPVKPKRGGNTGAQPRTMIFGGAADPAAPKNLDLPPANRDVATDPSGADVRDAIGGPVPMQGKDFSHNVTSPNLPDIGDEIPESLRNQDDSTTLNPDEQQPSTGPELQPVRQGAGDQGDDEATLALASSGKRRTVIALVVVGIVVIGLLAAAAWKLYGDQLMAPKVAPVVLQQLETEQIKLKADDSASKLAAIKGLSTLVANNPAYVEGHAALVTAYVLQLDDLQQNALRLEKWRNEKNNRITKYNQEKQPSDWEARGKQLEEEVRKLNDQLTTLVGDEKNVDGQLRAEYGRFASAAQQAGHATLEAQRAALRAQALYQAYGGSDKALTMLKDFRALGPNDGDGFIDLVAAEYAVNAKVTDATIAQAMKDLEGLRAKDGTFMRVYTLEARIHMQKGQLDEAEAQVDRLLAVNAKHDVANQLKDAIKVMRSEKAQHERDIKEKKEEQEK
ncbi:MAG: zinc-ribbon domain-containing protein [Myxococcaceae bacterium]